MISDPEHSGDVVTRSPSALLCVRDLVAGYGSLPVLRGLNLDLYQGEVLGVVGPNGAGKSTLLRVLTGEIRASSGSVRFQASTETSSTRPNLLRVPQRPDLPPFLTLLELVALGVQAWRPEVSRPGGLARELLGRWGLSERTDRPVRLASPGEIRRALLAMVDGVRPKILLLDEVLSALDPGIVLRAEELIESLGARGTGTLIVSHDMGLAERIPARVVLLCDGVITESWTRREIADQRRSGLRLVDLFLEHTGRAR